VALHLTDKVYRRYPKIRTSKQDSVKRKVSVFVCHSFDTKCEMITNIGGPQFWRASSTNKFEEIKHWSLIKYSKSINFTVFQNLQHVKYTGG